jgi:hypothetical protein
MERRCWRLWENFFSAGQNRSALFFLRVISSLVLFSDRVRLWTAKHVVICRTFGAQRLPSVFRSCILQMGGANPDWTELLYIRFSVQSLMGGDALMFSKFGAGSFKWSIMGGSTLRVVVDFPGCTFHNTYKYMWVHKRGIHLNFVVTTQESQLLNVCIPCLYSRAYI